MARKPLDGFDLGGNFVHKEGIRSYPHGGVFFSDLPLRGFDPRR